MPFIYFFFFVNILVLFSNYIYSLGVNKFKFLFNLNTKPSLNNTIQINKPLVLNDCKSFSFFKRKTKQTDYEKRLKLKKYNQQLNRCLKTLDYLTYVEINSGFKNNIEEQLLEILNLKVQVQKDIIDITSKINQYKLSYKIF